MSLLLDALKKAAEQKAAKEDATITQTVSTSDETIVLDDTRTAIDNTVAFDEDRTEYQEDETIVFAKSDNTELEEKTEVVDADATELTQLEEDATEILDDGEVTEFLDNYDATQIVGQQAGDAQVASDSDEAVQNYEEDATQLDLKQTLDSEKTVDNMGIIDAAYLARINKNDPADLTDDDVTAFMGEHELPGKVQDYSSTPDASDSDIGLEVTEMEREQQNYDATESEDTSLNLVEMDDPASTQGFEENATQITESLITGPQVTNSQITDSQITDAEVQILAQNSNSTESLNLVDIPENRASNNDTVTNRAVAFGGLTNEETLTRQDSTSTRTYAPDNYDRTLIKIDQDDASKLFAGMKSESDVLMTPDYAKKVFISNSSVQRLNNYKIYSGVAATILLVILILGLFEYEDESNNIDNSLRALKRDPMPNLPKRSIAQEQTNLFSQTGNAGIDTKTLALVENAGDLADLTTQTPEIITDDVEASGTIKSSDATVDEKAAEQAIEQKNVDSSKIMAASNTKVISKTTQKGALSQSQPLQLSSKNSFTEKDKLLKDAYAAYQRGDNNTALEKYNRVLADDPQNRNALLARAAINVQNDKSADAIKDYQTLLIANPKDSLAMSSLISVASISPTKSESQLKGMIRDEPTSPHLNFALANVYGAQNRWQEAQDLYFKALENNPNDPNYAYNLAVSLEHISKPKVAITYYQRALINFNNGLAIFNREVVDQRVEILKQL